MRMRKRRKRFERAKPMVIDGLVVVRTGDW